MLHPIVTLRRVACAIVGTFILGTAASLSLGATFPVATSTQFTSALAAVQPGDEIVVSGTIAGGKFVTSRAGTASAPITIRGDGTARISASPYALEILHDYYRLDNLILQNSSKGLVITGASHGAVNNVHVMDIKQEGIKLRDSSQFWVFTYCSVRRAGTSGDFGEGFYVGQAASNWSGSTPDECAFVTFFNCYATDTVNDGWDIKEGSHHIKVVNCTADYSGAVEPRAGSSHGNAGFYNRADNVQYIKCRVNALDNGTWGFRYSNDTVDGVDYGSTGNQIKQSAVTGGSVGFVFAEAGTNGIVYSDYTEASSGDFYATNNGTVSAPVTIASPSSFAERTWSGEGGGLYGGLDPSIGAAGDPLNSGPAAVADPTFSPAGGNYTTAQNVTLFSATSGATLRYTTNGSTPTSTSGTVYTGPITVTSNTTLKAIAYKTGLRDSAVSTAVYTIGTVAGGSRDLLIAQSSDDAKQRATGSVVTNSWRHELGYDGTEQLEIGLRYVGLPIPPGATVTTAYLQFEADKSNSGACQLTIRAQLSPSAATFTTATNNITSRPLTASSVAWSPAAWTAGSRGPAQRTPDLKTLVQAVVSQPTWSSGNPIVLVITGTGTRTAEAVESGAAKAAVLHVEWQ